MGYSRHPENYPRGERAPTRRYAPTSPASGRGAAGIGHDRPTSRKNTPRYDRHAVAAQHPFSAGAPRALGLSR
ncbi:hypothetical protein DAA51_06785 [Bradyrhizobium sp. WBAH10]|nr:hypothetical protein [Bradyrhizobium sp. WBAH30]MDD1543844.1 hypothetical protein [Bradyrhizobium sp. WBAH41]MDD1557871.1 hypothetical protein [Bradyrhizobium sp. WBAH23]MDD1565284.1 hypothetical protein [Bradyrhizobium sp. WBAH33]MDD1592225.1 hypothetical protein [Bradyrhizobium sp. WBAH42]NRB88396.1 hypothetical protein [Bradyrhizobium sp. WBAH10]QCJ88441.1 hypothetical protein DAA57_07905 [Bradyrhizobium yuanmingense]